MKCWVRWIWRCLSLVHLDTLMSLHALILYLARMLLFLSRFHTFCEGFATFSVFSSSHSPLTFSSFSLIVLHRQYREGGDPPAN